MKGKTKMLEKAKIFDSIHDALDEMEGQGGWFFWNQKTGDGLWFNPFKYAPDGILTSPYMNSCDGLLATHGEMTEFVNLADIWPTEGE
jgi:hypothetical protein